MDAVQHADAVTRRVESLPGGHVVALTRVLPGRPRTVWPVWEEVASGVGPALVAEQVEEPTSWRGRWETDGRTTWVAVDLGLDGGQTVLTVQHAVPDDAVWQETGPAGVGLRWDVVLRELGERLDPEGDGAEAPAAGVQDGDFLAATTELWVAAHVQAGAPPEAATRQAAEASRRGAQSPS
ncbi:hypothetical protein [Kytococcus sedentarius]|uniref:hypothetical protein n=1 Tax=Kytococcus sedentarius TaxID=1276 RepID=UPI0035BC5F64